MRKVLNFMIKNGVKMVRPVGLEYSSAPDPVFRYFSNSIAQFSLKKVTYVCSFHGLNLAVYSDLPLLC